MFKDLRELCMRRDVRIMRHRSSDECDSGTSYHVQCGQLSVGCWREMEMVDGCGGWMRWTVRAISNVVGRTLSGLSAQQHCMHAGGDDTGK